MILIPKNIYSKLTFLVGGSNYISNSPADVYDDLGVEFLTDLSKNLLSQKDIRKYPDVATFAFWCRASNLKIIINNPLNNYLRVGLGLVYHNSPSNVPVNFAFSLAFTKYRVVIVVRVPIIATTTMISTRVKPFLF